MKFLCRRSTVIAVHIKQPQFYRQIRFCPMKTFISSFLRNHPKTVFSLCVCVCFLRDEVFIFHGLMMFVQCSRGGCWVATAFHHQARFYMCCQGVCIAGTCCLHLATCHARAGVISVLGFYNFAQSLHW